MDLNEMRKKFRENKEKKERTTTSVQESNVSTDLNNQEDSMECKPVKSGSLSTVKITDPSYKYENGANTVSLSCSRIDNTCDEPTGLLMLSCWISEKQRENDRWQNENYGYVDSIELGSLNVGSGFPDVNITFDISDDYLKIIDNMNKEGVEWHFVFTVDELYEDDKQYIIHTLNGPNENENKETPCSDSCSTGESSVSRRVKAIIANYLSFSEDEVVENATFADLGADSLDTVDLIMAFEKEFDIKISEDQSDNVRTVGDAIRYIESLL